MKAFYNNEWVKDFLKIQFKDRAFQFGDGLFETIVIKHGTPRYLPYHYARLAKGAHILNIKLPWKNTNELNEQMASFMKDLHLEDSNVKLMVWRKTSQLGGYNFNSLETNFMFIHRPFPSIQKIIRKADFARSITFNYSSLSSIKTLNALPYILASNEKQQRKLNEIIVLNSDGYICECSSSNIFWVKNDTFYTSPLKSGCLDGVMRRVIIEKLVLSGKKLEEQLVAEEEILEADTVFATNSLGVRYFESIADKKFDTKLSNSDLLVV